MMVKLNSKEKRIIRQLNQTYQESQNVQRENERLISRCIFLETQVSKLEEESRSSRMLEKISQSEMEKANERADQLAATERQLKRRMDDQTSEIQQLQEQLRQKEKKTEAFWENRLKQLYPSVHWHSRALRQFLSLSEQERWSFERTLRVLHSEVVVEVTKKRPHVIKETKVGNIQELEVGRASRFYYQQSREQLYIYGLSTKKNGGSHSQEKMIHWLRRTATPIVREED